MTAFLHNLDLGTINSKIKIKLKILLRVARIPQVAKVKMLAHLQLLKTTTHIDSSLKVPCNFAMISTFTEALRKIKQSGVKL
jgi:hypothetical protein